jgi:putative ABC transport system permease protein
VSDDELNRNEVDYRAALPNLFRSMGTHVREGRTFAAADSRRDAPPVVVVDEKMARLAWPGESAVGKRMLLLRPGSGGAYQRFWAEVVGVVEHVRYHDLRTDSRETIYFPWRDWGFHATLTIRTSTDPASVAGVVRDEIRAFDPAIPQTEVRPMAEYVDAALAPTRFAMIMIGLFGAVALVLATVGLYGIISYSVRRRAWEFGLRMAFGARRSQILRSVIGQGLGLTIMGMAVGMAGSLVLTQAMASLLFQVEPIDPLTLAAIPVPLTVIALLATFIPAHRATTADPTATLRSE